MFKNKKDDGVTIVGERSNELNDQRMRKSLIIAAATLLFCGIAYGGYYYWSNNASVNPERQAYLEAKKSYEEAGIKNYTEEDFKKQKEQSNIAEVGEDGKVKAAEEAEKKPEEVKEDEEGKTDLGSGVKVDIENFDPVRTSSEISNSGYSLTDQNTSQLNLINYTEPEVNVTSELIATSILRDLNKYNESIKSNVGWPESQYDTRNYGAAQKYIRELVEYPRTGKTPARNIYNFGFDQQLGQVRYSIYHGVQLEISNGSDSYSKILSQFLAVRPEFSGIQSVSVVYEDEMYDSYSSKIKAIIIADGRSYVAHLSIEPESESKLRLLDIG